MGFYLDKRYKKIITDGIDKSRYVKVPDRNALNRLQRRSHKDDRFNFYLEEMLKDAEGPWLARVSYSGLKRNEYDIKGMSLRLKNSMSYGLFLKETKPRTDDTFFLEKQYGDITKNISSFFAAKSEGRLQKMGILLYGEPGNGKSKWINYLVNDVLEKDAIKVWCGNYIPDSDQMAAFSEIDALKVFIFEELTTNVASPTWTRQFLEFMDGETSIDNSLIIATTNYPHELPGNIVDRRGRFDYIVKFDSPKEEDRKFLIEKYLGSCGKDELSLSKGMSIADIVHICDLVKRNGTEFGKVVDDIKKHKEFVKNAFQKPKSLGIGASFDEDEEDF